MIDYYEDLCPFCENNLLLMYLCESCNAVFCGDCIQEAEKEVLMCSDCGYEDIQESKSDKFVCNRCDSENIISVKKTIQICPNCASSYVIRITEKVTQLKEKFKKIILGTRQSLEPLNMHMEKIKDLRNELLKLRQGSLKIFHFPKLEIELLQLIKLYNNLKEAVKQKTIDFYDAVNRNLKYFCNIDLVQPKILPIIEAISDSFQKNSMETTQFAVDSVKCLDDKIGAISIKLRFMNSIQKIFVDYLPYIDIDHDEKVVFGLKCKLDGGEAGDVEYKSRNGTILLSNKRLYFLHEKGFIKKNVVLLFSVLIEDLQTIQVEGKISKKLSLEFVNSMYKFKLNKEKREQLMDFIEKARIFDDNIVDEESLLTLKQNDVTLETFTKSLEDAIYTIITYINKGIRFHIEIPEEKFEKFDYRVNSSSLHNNNASQSRSQLQSDNSEYKDYPNISRWFGNTTNATNVSRKSLNQTQKKSGNKKVARKPLYDRLVRIPRYDNYQGSRKHKDKYDSYFRQNPRLGYMYETYQRRGRIPRQYVNPSKERYAPQYPPDNQYQNMDYYNQNEQYRRPHPYSDNQQYDYHDQMPTNEDEWLNYRINPFHQQSQESFNAYNIHDTDNLNYNDPWHADMGNVNRRNSIKHQLRENKFREQRQHQENRYHSESHPYKDPYFDSASIGNKIFGHNRRMDNTDTDEFDPRFSNQGQSAYKKRFDNKARQSNGSEPRSGKLYNSLNNIRNTKGHLSYKINKDLHSHEKTTSAARDSKRKYKSKKRFKTMNSRLNDFFSMFPNKDEEQPLFSVENEIGERRSRTKNSEINLANSGRP
ncbi:MAG: hypothetical protein GF364_16660, partial [Candidatus Lokiarchaeota archaeon]|nr:hypothetical protein [Candidatus Lokiarchaeota archaeon]